ncbi:hypothetical protein [uncultured Sphaerochaeta sp.]|nr:hypothetical protein [uncultured Sphaerochaeta sp.]
MKVSNAMILVVFNSFSGLVGLLLLENFFILCCTYARASQRKA